MDFPPTRHNNQSSTLSSDPTLPEGLEPEIDALAFPFTLYDGSPVYFNSQSNPLHVRFSPAQPGLAVAESSTFPATAHAPPPTMNYSPWNGTLSSNNDPSALPIIPGTSESSVPAAGNASGYNAVGTSSHTALINEREHKTRAIFPYHLTYPGTYPALTGGQAVSASEHPEHVVLWYLVCWNAVILNGPREFIPQTIYQPHSQGDKERYVSLAKLHPPIIFIAQDSPEWGIPIQHLLSRQMVRLVEGNEPAFASCGPSVGIRVQWPGYQPFHKQVATKDYTRSRRMISKAKLAKVVARCVKQFMVNVCDQAMQIGSNELWRVSPLNIKVDDIILVSLHHVSQGSWQPHLRLRRDVAAHVAAGPQGLADPDIGVESCPSHIFGAAKREMFLNM